MGRPKTPKLVKWKPDGLICQKCGAPNPDGGPRCGNCDEITSLRLNGLLATKQPVIREALKTTTRRN